jgi:O-succinylbenzoate synthase
LAGPLRTTSEEWLADVSHLRFEFAKFKVGLDSKFEAEKLKSWLADWPQGLKIRLDFNESLSEEGFHNWLQNFGRDELALVDFIEDPFQYSKASWSRIDGVTLALDRSLNESTVGEWLSGAVVVKPARIAANQLEFEKDQRVIFTNYMDHPVGEMFAVYEAARFYEQKSPEVCGLRTHHLFESNAFSEQIHSASPTLEVAEGAGIGFDNLLGEQSWQPL